jgi:hypothetical protein
MKLEEDYRTQKGRTEGTMIGYTVEARYNYHTPIQLGNQLFDERWREVRFEDGHGVGIPNSPSDHKLLKSGLRGYAAAQALRWWVHAAADADMSYFCLETRLVKHELKYNQSVEAVSVHDVVGGENRSHIMPDWNDETESE